MTLVAATAVPGIGELGLILYGLVIGFVTIRGVFLGLARPLPWWLRIPATAAGVGAVGWQFHTPSPEAGVALLSLMLALKLWEAQSPRDYYITVAMGWFLLVSGFLFNQDLWVTPYLLIVAWGWLTWLGTYFGFLQTPAAWRETGIYWWGAWRLLLPALPLALLLFLFFPRLSAPLWSTRIGDPSSAKTGLSERMAPGSINRLVQSEEIAFRAEFEGPFPPAAERYWRGPVMFQTDGREWWASPQPLPGRPPVMLQRPGLNYRVVMEPSQQNWLFPLDWLGDAPPGTLATRLGELRLLHPLKKRQSFQLSAHPGVPMILPTEDRQAALRLPRNLTPRIRDLAKRFESQAAGSSHRKTIAAVLAYFNTEPFHYSLQPPLTGDRPADEFLFETRQGFCEHFASS
ncbi:MAG: transglutaminaseTgpA domain-containing protein, partial [Pseudomonadota bacterium]